MKRLFKKYTIAIFCATAVFFNTLIGHASSELDLYSVAATLYGEAGSLEDQGIYMVAETIRNRYNFYNQRKKVDSISLRDIVIAKSQYLGFDKYKNKSLSQLKQEESRMSGQARRNWDRCMAIARQVADGTLSTNYARGAAAFNQASVNANKRTFKTESVFSDPSHWLGSSRKSPHVFIGDFQIMNLMSPSGKKLASGGFIGDNNTSGEVPSSSTEDPENPTQSSGSQSQETQPGSDDDGSDNACSLASMKKKYLNSGAIESACWYCKVVIVLTNAYLKVAAQAIPTSVALGEIILKYGFMIWLAYYILQQVSSMKPITPGKTLQEILIMGFKVAVASVILGNALQFISEYLLNPIIGFGTDYGMQLLNGIQRTGG